MPRTRQPAHLALRLSSDSRPLSRRIADSIIAELSRGGLHAGDALPSSRTLAASLSVSRGAVVAAYDELIAAGFITARAGSGTIIAPGAADAARAGAHSSAPTEPSAPTHPTAARSTATKVTDDLRPGRPDVSLIDARAWQRAWRKATPRALDPHQTDPRPDHAELRAALADYIRRHRGFALDPESILVVPGVAAALRAVPSAFGLQNRQVAVEDPGYIEARIALHENGCRVRGLPVDADGLDPARLTSRDLAVYVTPSHQYPLGGRMPVAARGVILEWATQTGGLIIEDDYDSEFRYDVAPLPALRSLHGADKHVVYIGTASKLLSPALRVGWIAPPPHLVEPLRQELAARHLTVNALTGAALAGLIAEGSLSAHHARAARTYAARRARLVAALRKHLAAYPLLGIDAGLHLVMALPDDAADSMVADALLQRGIHVTPLSRYSVTTPRQGLVLGYATLPETRAETVARTIAKVVARRSLPTHDYKSRLR